MKHLRAFVLDLHTEGELPGRYKADVEAHLAACSRCRAAAVGRRRLRLALSRLPASRPSPGLVPRITRAVDRGRRAAGRAQRAVAAGALVCAMAGAFVVAASVPEIREVIANASQSAPAGWDFTPSQLLEGPADVAASAISGAWAWGAGLSEGVGEAVVLAVALLALSTFVGLSRLLRPSPHAATA